MAQRDEKRIVIVGAGVIGASIAYHLSLKNQSATVIEQCEPACAASGKSGGFLALDWCDSSPLKNLARPSFNMHEQYAASLGNDIGYRRLESYAVSLVSPQSRSARRRKASTPDSLSWLDGDAQVQNVKKLGTTRTIAQVLPKALTLSLLESAKRNAGTDVEIARVENVNQSGNTWVLKLRNRDGVVSPKECDVVILCMGPWTITARTWFPSLPPIMAHKAASLVVKANVPATALSVELVNSREEVTGPEAYPRQDEVYLCLDALPADLPEDPNQIVPHRRDVSNLKEFGRAISSQLREALAEEENIVATQACNLPVTPDGMPIIGRISGTNGSAFVAAGHSCWGMLNSQATGKAIADLILSGTSSIDISAFAPGRFA